LASSSSDDRPAKKRMTHRSTMSSQRRLTTDCRPHAAATTIHRWAGLSVDYIYKMWPELQPGNIGLMTHTYVR